MQKKVLITGGTGLVGGRLTELLLEKGYSVSYLSRSEKPYPQVKVYTWDIERKEIEVKALQEADYIIHLAGAGVADKPWTEERKKVILESRTHSTRLLAETLEKIDQKPQAFISASAIGIYGNARGDELLKETSQAADTFLAYVTKEWEKSVDQVAKLGIAATKIRIGVVLSSKGGALEKLSQPIRWGAGAALGSGKQFMSWIHIDDLCRMFIYAMEKAPLGDVFNGVAPKPERNAAFTQKVANALGRPLFLPNVPSFALKLMVGEMADMLLGGLRVSSEKIEKEGFSFTYPNLEGALKDLLK